MAQIRIVVYDDENREISAHDIVRVKNIQLAKDMAKGLADKLSWYKKQDNLERVANEGRS
jgi:hypothetical protein